MNLKDQLLDLRSAIKSFETEFDSRLDACLQQVSLPWASVLRRGRLLGLAVASAQESRVDGLADTVAVPTYPACVLMLNVAFLGARMCRSCVHPH